MPSCLLASHGQVFSKQPLVWLMLTAVNQIEIHPFLAWDECVSYCEQEGIAVMAYSPLAKAMKLKAASLTQIAKKYAPVVVF